jgi:hypothetical protein
MKKLLIGLLAISSLCSFAQDIKVIKKPRVETPHQDNLRITCNSDMDSVCRLFGYSESVDVTCKKKFSISLNIFALMEGGDLMVHDSGALTPAVKVIHSKDSVNEMFPNWLNGTLHESEEKNVAITKTSINSKTLYIKKISCLKK